jgi:bacterioferritin-associated ferredoxin
MLRHEHFEEICAAASVGQATGEELVELEHHASECGRCRQAYFNYLNVAAQQFATAKQDPTISPKAMEECIDSELFLRRFLDRAEREGITFSVRVFTKRWVEDACHRNRGRPTLRRIRIEWVLFLERFIQSQPQSTRVTT